MSNDFDGRYSWDASAQTITRKVRVTSSAWTNKTGVDLTVCISFEGVESEKLHEWASRAVLLNLQRALRTADREFVVQLSKSLYKRHATMLGVVEDPRKVVEKAAQAIDNLDEEQLELLLARIKARKKANGGK